MATASSEKAKSTIVIKRIKKASHGAHGAAWKIAYADFVTAMMAFFLLMWLLGSTTKGDLKGIKLDKALLDQHGLADAQAVGALPEPEQRALVSAVLRREVGVMACSALVVVFLALRAASTAHGF